MKLTSLLIFWLSPDVLLGGLVVASGTEVFAHLQPSLDAAEAEEVSAA